MKQNPTSLFLAVLVAASLGIVYYFLLPEAWKTPGTRLPSSTPPTVADYERARLARISQTPSPFQSAKTRIDLETAAQLAPRMRALNPRGLKGATAEASARLPQGLRLALTIDNDCVARGEAGTMSAGFRAGSPGFATARAPANLRIESRALVLDSDTDLARITEEAERDDCVLGVAVDGKVRKNGAYDGPIAPSQNQIAALGARDAADFFYRSSFVPTENVKIAIVDSGIDYTHPDLTPAMWRSPLNTHGYDFVNGDNDPRDDEGHGTHVAGIAAARGGNAEGGAGIMPSHAALMAVKVLDANGDGYYSDVANGIRWAADNGAHVINLSLSGSGASATVEDALVYAVNRGAVITLAAGNSNIRIGDSSNFVTPASYGIKYAGIITIGSVDALTHRKSSFSNFGSGVEAAAPGSNGILSTLPGNDYDYLQGTSMAAPAAAGVAALAIGALRAMQVPYTPQELESALLRSATRNANLDGYVKDRAELNLPRLTETLRHDYLLSLEGGFDD